MLEIIALIVSFQVWWLLAIITVVSFLITYIISPPPVDGSGIMPFPDPTGAIYFVICIILNLIMWLIYFIAT